MSLLPWAVSEVFFYRPLAIMSDASSRIMTAGGTDQITVTDGRSLGNGQITNGLLDGGAGHRHYSDELACVPAAGDVFG